MTTDYRAELQRLVKAYDDHGGKWPENEVEALHQAVERARALLDQPEPEGLTDGEILNLSEEHCVSYTRLDGSVTYPYENDMNMKDDVLSFARALIAADRARWGRPTIEPVPASERPWEREGWCDAKGQCWMGDGGGNGFVPSWRLCKPSDCRLRWSLPHYALPVPETNGKA